MKEKNLNYTIAKELSAERIMQEKTQSDMAEKLGTQKSNISRFEKGSQNASLSYIEAYAAALGKSVSLVMEDAASVILKDCTEYVLKLYDQELLRFSMERSPALRCRILSVAKNVQALLPVDLELSDSGILSWLNHRIIPSNRSFVGEILSSLSLERGDVKGIIDVCKGLSLNDSYWIVPADSDLLYSNYNLYQNNFSEVLSLVAYTGRPYSGTRIQSSPELTTNGVLRKAWRNKGQDGIWLYKGGTEDFANAGNEPFSEFYACQIAEAMGLRAVHYELENWKGILASKCRLFTDIDTSYVSAGKLVRSGGLNECFEYYKTLGPEYYEDLCSMLIFDALILNEDRHFGNFGLLRDNRTGKFIGTAPVFDNGNSLLCYAMPSDFQDIEVYIKGRTTPYGVSFTDIIKPALGRKQKSRLRKLIGFKFTESNVCNLPSWRLRALEDMLQERIKYMLSL